MKVKALRQAAYLLIAHFLIYVALGFFSQGRPDYAHLVLAAALLIGATGALFSPRKRGWLAVILYAIFIFSHHAVSLWVTLNNPTVPMDMKVTTFAIMVLIDSLVIAALVLVFKPANFAAFTSIVPSPATSSGQAAVSGATQNVELAGRGDRFGAAMFDGIIAIISVAPILYATGLWEYVLKGQQPPYISTLGLSALGFAAFVLVNGYFLKKSGQTIGKKMVGIQIVDLDGKVPGLATLLGRRYLPIFLINLVPGVGGLLALIDDLFIFRSDRRCVHDLIARTKVILSGAKKSSANWLVRSAILLVIIFILGILAGVAIPAYKDYQRRAQEAEAKMATPAPAKPATPQVTKKPSPTSAIPAAPKPVNAVAEPALPTTVGAKTTSSVTAIALEPAKPATPQVAKEPALAVPATPKPDSTVAGSPSPATATAVTDQKALAKLPRDTDSAAKSSAARPKWHAPTDLRYCLDLPSNEAIAKCAGE